MDSQHRSSPPTIQQLQERIAQLEDENFKLKNLMDILPGDLYWKDKNGVWAGMNKRCAQSLQRMGFIKEGLESEVIGKTDSQLFNQITAEGYRQNDLKVMETKRELSREEITQLPNGEKIVLLSTKSPMLDKKGNIIGIAGNTINITYLKKIEEELQEAKNNAEAASLAKTEFLSNMRHDIRTPLSGIVGFSEILKSESKDPRIKEYADNLVASSHALLNLMDEVLEAVRVSSGEVPILKKKFNLAQLCEQIVALYKARALEKRLKLALKWDENLPHFVIGDKIRIHRIALELIGNALNFTNRGFVNIDVTLVKKEEQRLIIKLKICDSGIGIPREKQQEIYVQFKRLTPSYQGIYKGIGLGLYVVKQFIDELNGEIYVESEPGKGTCFTCLIPLQTSLLDDDSGIDHSDDLRIPPSLETPPLPVIAKETYVLVVEDNHIAQAVAKALLAAMSCRVDIAANGVEALALYDKNHYDLIFMDIGLGEGMDGYEITQKIRSKEDDNHHTPIIGLTAHAIDESRQSCIESGMEVVLTKPLTREHAGDILNTFVPSRRSVDTSIKHDLPPHDDELFALDEFPLLDHKQALKNCGNNTILVELLTLMISQELPADLELMNNAYAKKDFNSVEKIAHKIKGGAVYVGTTRMKNACQYLERYWKTGERELFDKLYQQAIKTIDDTCVYIKNWLKKAM
jgi:signal transduction histidine kinase/HPt (histidine-containing phosphotransfer) domain-containing protein/AmiR/NasT family two-component response regulator